MVDAGGPLSALRAAGAPGKAVDDAWFLRDAMDNVQARALRNLFAPPGFAWELGQRIAYNKHCRAVGNGLRAKGRDRLGRAAGAA